MNVYVLFAVSAWNESLMAIYSRFEEAEKERKYWEKYETNPNFSYQIKEIKVHDFYGE